MICCQIEETKKTDYIELMIEVHTPTALEQALLITEVYYDSYQPNDRSEYIRIHNPSAMPVDISGWRIVTLCNLINNNYDNTYKLVSSVSELDIDTKYIIPEGTILDGGESMYIVRNRTAFYKELCINVPGESFATTHYAIESYGLSSSLNNRGEFVMMVDRYHHIIDVVAYGSINTTAISSIAGWYGPPALPVREGHILMRKRAEEGWGESYVDTNTSADWNSIRPYKIGQSEFKPSTFQFMGQITTFVSPDSSYTCIVNELDNAVKTIFINMYEFQNPYLAERLINATARGVNVKIILEGMPPGGLTDTSRYIAHTLYEAGCELRYLISSPDEGIYARYRYTHAKYCVIDNWTVILSSENFAVTGIPVNNTFGNRGWGVIIRNPDVAQYFSTVFLEDWSSNLGDSFPYDPEHPVYGKPPEDFDMSYTIHHGTYRPRFDSQTICDEFTVEPVLAPDTATLQTQAILGMINAATESVYIEQLQCHINWSTAYCNYSNLYLEAAINAARRGCEVKILLDSRYVDPTDDQLDNYDTVQYINALAQREGLTDKLHAKLIYLDNIVKLHNKGVIVDGYKTLISSINWGRVSATENREAGIIIESEAVARYFTNVFLYDWNLTVNEQFRATILRSHIYELNVGESCAYTVSITNRGNTTELLNLSLSGIPSGWHAALSAYNLLITPKQVVEVTLHVSAPLAIINGTSSRIAEISIYGTWNNMSSELAYTRTIIKVPAHDKYLPEDAYVPPKRYEPFSKTLEAWLTIIIIIIGIFMISIARDYIRSVLSKRQPKHEAKDNSIQKSKYLIRK
jgi:phosphatidylserine/phosphatidylglycerophosphate/cardiolipin synthase-like enzyme